MDEFPENNEIKNFDKDSLSDESISHDSLLNENSKDSLAEEFPIRRKGSYTIETTDEMSESIRTLRLRKPLFIKTDSSRYSYASEKSSDVDSKMGSQVSQKNMMTQSMYERPWTSSKKNHSIVSAISKQRESKLRLAKEEQNKKQLQKAFGLSETEKQAEIARKRKEIEINKKVEEKKLKDLERQRIVEDRKKRLAQAEEARKARILQKMTNQEERHHAPHTSTNMMTMSCYGALGSAKIRPGNKEVIKERFIAKRPVSSTGKIMGFGSSSPRIICENNIKTISKHPPKISDYLMERSQILSRPLSSRIPDGMITSVITPNPPISQNRPFARQNSLREQRRPVSAMISSVIDDSVKYRPSSQLIKTSVKENNSNGKTLHLSSQSRVTSRKNNTITEEIDYPGIHDHSSGENKHLTEFALKHKLTQSNKSNNTQIKLVRDRPSSAKPIQHKNNLIERGIVQSKSSTFPKSMDIHRTNRCKVDVHLDSDSIEDEGITLTESINQPRSITSSISQKKSEINRTDLSSADSLDTENPKEKVLETENMQKAQNVNSENLESKPILPGRALPTKDLTEADYKTRLMENRRLIREKREREREQLMKAERDRRHTEESTMREIMELEKNKITNSEDVHFTTSNDDAVEDKLKLAEEKIAENNSETQNNSVSIEISEYDQNTDKNNELEKEEKLRLERKKRLDSIMSRVKKTTEESSSEGGGVSPRRAMSPELAELDTEMPSIQSNQVFRSTLLQSMMNKGKLSGISKTPSPSIKDPEEAKSFQENIFSASNSNETPGIVPLTSLRESIEDSESLANNVNSKSSVAVRSSGMDGNSLSDANSDFVVDPETFSNSLATDNNDLKVDREDCISQEDHFRESSQPDNCEEIKSNGVTNQTKAKKYSSTSSIETEEDEIIKNPFNQDHIYNSHIIRPLAQEGFVSQS